MKNTLQNTELIPENAPNFTKVGGIEHKNADVKINDLGERNLQNLVENIENKEEGEKSQVLVVRCWNKDTESVSDFLERVKKFKNSLSNVEGLFVSVNGDGEKDHMTTKAIAELEGKFDFPIVPLSVEKSYTWTSGLNAPVYTLASRLSEERLNNTSVINMSFDVDMDESELGAFGDSLKNNSYSFTMRHSSDGSLEKKYDNQDIILQTAKKVIRGQKLTQDEEVDLVYFLRNTLGVFPIQKVIEMGGFNPLCNGKEHVTIDNENSNETVQIFGMEDLDIWLRMIRQKDPQVLRGLLKSMKSPVNYTDTAWKNLPESKKIIKGTNEKLALILIFAGKSLGLVKDGQEIDFSDTLIIPEELRDFDIKKKPE